VRELAPAFALTAPHTLGTEKRRQPAALQTAQAVCEPLQGGGEEGLRWDVETLAFAMWEGRVGLKARVFAALDRTPAETAAPFPPLRKGRKGRTTRAEGTHRSSTSPQRFATSANTIPIVRAMSMRSRPRVQFST
jgi:hypothetical protein